MNEEDGEFDYRALHAADIEYAILHIDGEKFPKNLANARAALEARRSGISPEPPPVLDSATDAKYTYWVEKAIGTLIGGYGVFGLWTAQIWWVRTRPPARIIHLTGIPAQALSTALLFIAGIAFVAPKGHPLLKKAVPWFSWVYLIALLLIFAAVGAARLAGVA